MGCNSSRVAALDVADVHPEKGANTAAADPVPEEKKGLRADDAQSSPTAKSRSSASTSDPSLGSGDVQYTSVIPNTAAADPKQKDPAAPPSDDVLRALSSIDDRLVEALERGDIRLLCSAWVDQQPDTYRLQFRQELEKLPGALLPPKKAVALVRRCNRGAGALTYGERCIEPTLPWTLHLLTRRARQVGCPRAIPIQRGSASEWCVRRWHRTSTSRGSFGSTHPAV